MHRSFPSASRQRRLAPPCHRPTSHCCRKPADVPRSHTAFLPCAYPARTPLCRCTCLSGHSSSCLFRYSATRFSVSVLRLPFSERPISPLLPRALRSPVFSLTLCAPQYASSWSTPLAARPTAPRLHPPTSIWLLLQTPATCRKSSAPNATRPCLDRRIFRHPSLAPASRVPSPHPVHRRRCEGEPSGSRFPSPSGAR